MKRMFQLVLPLLAVAGTSRTVHIDAQSAAGAISTITRPVSAVVAATTMARRGSTGQSTLALLTLWRGKTGWWTKGDQRRGDTGGTASTSYATIPYGGLNLRIDVNWNPAIAVRIQGKDVVLNPPDANVILVDGVDASEQTVVDTFRVDSAMPDGELRIESVLRKSQKIVSFLKCDAELADSPLRDAIKRFCNSIVAK